MADDPVPLPPAARLIGRPATPGPADQVASRLIQLGLQRTPPGQWADNKYRQLEHFTGVVSMAVRPYLDAVSGARFVALQRKTVRKAVAGAGHYSRDDEYEPIDPDHPLAQILENPGGPDGSWSMQQECSYLLLQKMLTGDAPAWLPVNEAGKPCQFFALTGASVQANIGVGQSAQYPNGSYRVLQAAGSTMWFAGLGATSAVIPAEQLHFLRDPHPLWRNAGMGRTQCGALEVDVLEAITRSRWSFFDRGAQLGVAIYVPGADEATCQRIQANFQQNHGGARNAYNVLVLGGSGGFDPQGKPLTVQQLGQSARELDFQASYEQSAAVVAALFKVPKVLMGLSESGSSYAADWAAQRRFYDLGLAPEVRALSAFLSRHLAGPWCEEPGQYRIECECDPPQNVESHESELQFALQNNVIYVNSYNAAHNRPPVEGGDAPLAVYTAKLQQAAQPRPTPDGPQTPPAGAEVQPDDQAPDGAESGPDDEHASKTATPTERKAMTTLDDSAGGFLVPPAGPSKRKRRKMRRMMADVLKGL